MLLHAHHVIPYEAANIERIVHIVYGNRNIILLHIDPARAPNCRGWVILFAPVFSNGINPRLVFSVSKGTSMRTVGGATSNSAFQDGNCGDFDIVYCWELSTLKGISGLWDYGSNLPSGFYNQLITPLRQLIVYIQFYCATFVVGGLAVTCTRGQYINQMKIPGATKEKILVLQMATAIFIGQLARESLTSCTLLLLARLFLQDYMARYKADNTKHHKLQNNDLLSTGHKRTFELLPLKLIL